MIPINAFIFEDRPNMLPHIDIIGGHVLGGSVLWVFIAGRPGIPVAVHLMGKPQVDAAVISIAVYAAGTCQEALHGVSPIVQIAIVAAVGD
ncbi:hypothetical protein NIES4075_74160 [Tolypothrix sp. NIES-4075]|nr:hypothetical protein NIES4075_74160 [Tolypothrix sp. NIES-4075]